MAALMVSGAVRFKIHRVPTEKLGRRVLEKDDEEESKSSSTGRGGMSIIICIPEKGLGIKIREGRPQMYTCVRTELRRRVRAY